jgi:hypothetical protein
LIADLEAGRARLDAYRCRATAQMSRWKQPPFRPFDEMLWIARRRSLRGRMTGTFVLKNIREIVAMGAKMIYRNGHQERQHNRATDAVRRLRARRLKIPLPN